MKILDLAIQYCRDVESGKEITTDEVKQQCKIFLEDYEVNQYKDDFEFFICEKKLKVINNILKVIYYATGFVAGKTVFDGIVGFQCLILVAIFGWRYKSDHDKFRYRDIVLFITRKNAKTFLIALIFILLMLTEQNFSEFYSICIDRELAKEVRKAMAQIIKASPVLDKHFFVSDSEIGIIRCELTHSFYYPRTSKANKNNSIRPAAVCADEVGAFTDNDNIQAMRKGQLSVKNPLMFKTTTAYAESDSIMPEEIEYDRAVLDGTVKNDRLFCLLYYAPREIAWEDKAIYMANPLRVPENYEEIKRDRDIAKVKTSEQAEFLTKNLNIFLETDEEDKYIKIKYWKDCAISSEKFIEAIKGQNVTVGVDLSVTTDLTAVSIMFKKDDKIYCKSHGFLPSDNMAERREDIDYFKYKKLGYCDIHKGMTVKYSLVEKYIRSIEETYECTIETIVTDPMNAKEMMERLADDYDVILLKQTYTNLSPATKEFRKKIYDGEVLYEKNELLDWNMRNATTSKGKADDEMLNKENKHKQRIDMAAVLIFAYTQYVVEVSDYNPLDELEKQNW